MHWLQEEISVAVGIGPTTAHGAWLLRKAALSIGLLIVPYEIPILSSFRPYSETYTVAAILSYSHTRLAGHTSACLPISKAL